MLFCFKESCGYFYTPFDPFRSSFETLPSVKGYCVAPISKDEVTILQQNDGQPHQEELPL